MGVYSDSAPSSTTTQTYDPVANARAMDVLERQQEMSEEMWAKAKQIYEPYETEMVALNRKLLPMAAEVSTATMGEQLRDITENREIKDALRETQKTELGLSKPVMEKFYSESLNGVDVGERMGEMTSDVNQAYKNVEGELRRIAGRTGLKLTASQIKDIALQKAKDIAAARTAGRKSAEDESYGKLVTAMGVRGTGTGLPGISTTSGSNETQFGNYNLSDPSSLSMSGMSSVASNASGLAKRVTSSTTSESGGDDMSDFIGSLVGVGTGAAAGTLGTGLAKRLLN